MSDKVFIKNLILFCNVGVTEWERSKKQNVVFDIEICCNLKDAAATGELDKTINYFETKEKIVDAVTKSEFKLLETLAETVASIVLEDPNASTVTVAVKKEKYEKNPVMGIEISRERHG